MPASARKPDRILEPLKTGWCIAARLGSPAEPHVLAVLATRYEAAFKRMELVRATVQRVETIPGGKLQDVLDRFEAAAGAARKQQASSRIAAGLHVPVDVTRSPEARHLLMDRLPECVPVLCTKAVRDVWDYPYRVLGRLTLLSAMSAMLPRQQLAATVPEAVEDDRHMDRGRVREILSRAQAREPRLEEEELALGGSVDDDAALTIALGAWWASEQVPSPWREQNGS